MPYVREGWWHPNVKSGQVHTHNAVQPQTMHRLCEPVYTKRQERAMTGTLPNGEPCAYAHDYGRDAWAEHDHGACLDVNVRTVEVDPLQWTEITASLDGNGQLVTDLGTVEGVGTTYGLYSVSSEAESGEWTHEWVAVIYPPTPRMGKPKRSQSYPSNVALLAAVGADIDADLAVEAQS
jgi:hypothetical protein